jgi:ribosomal protein L16 Arg81 hydroxylase
MRTRLRTMRAALVALLGLVVLLAAACGGGGGGGGDRLTKGEFQDRANAICDKYQQQLNALDSPTSLDEIPDLVDQALQILNKEIDEISALNPPEELQSQFDELIAESGKTKEAATDLSAAAKANDQQAVQKALDEGNAASQKADQAAGRLGLDSCKG